MKNKNVVHQHYYYLTNISLNGFSKSNDDNTKYTLQRS